MLRNKIRSRYDNHNRLNEVGSSSRIKPQGVMILIPNDLLIPSPKKIVKYIEGLDDFSYDEILELFNSSDSNEISRIVETEWDDYLEFVSGGRFKIIGKEYSDRDDFQTYQAKCILYIENEYNVPDIQFECLLYLNTGDSTLALKLFK